MKKFVSSLLIFSFVVLLTPICPIYAANTLNYNANASSGITASGNISTATVDGQSVFYADTTTGNKTIYFDIDDGVINGNAEYKNATVKIEYIDSGESGKYFAFEYDSISNSQKRHELYGETTSEKKTRTAVFEIEDAYFGNRLKNADFSVVMPKMEIVYFVNVTVEISDKTSGVEIGGSTGKFGNIFFKEDEKSIDIIFTNHREIPISGTVTYTAKNEADGTIAYTSQKPLQIGKSNSVSDTVIIPSANLKFGTYVLEVNFSNSEQNISANTNLPFSVCKSTTANSKNEKIGVGAHFNWGGRNISGSMTLLDKAGFSNIREGYSWPSFETVANGERNYSEIDVCREFINSSYDKNMTTLIMAGYSNADVLKTIPAEVAAAAENGEEIELHYLPVTADGRKAYVDYVIKLLDIYNGKIDTVEVWNEPNLKQYCSNAYTVPTGVQRYAALLKDVYIAVKAKYPNVKVAGPIISSLMPYADAYLKEFLAQPDINNYYDVFSFHNYSYSDSYLDEIIINIRADLALIPEEKEVYITEFGVGNTAYSETKDEQYQAAGLAKYYLSMAAENFCDRYYVYQLSKENTRLESYGMLNYHNAKYPYTARPVFLSMANVNSLTAGSEGKGSTNLSTKLRKLSFENAAKHTATDVYFTVSGTENVSVEKSGKLTEFYDMYGNVLDIAEVDGAFSINATTEPIYAVTYYNDKLDVSVSKKFGELVVSGNVYTSHKGEVLTIKVFDDQNKLVYINQTPLDENLSFKFSFVPLNESTKYTVKLGNVSFDEIHTTEYIVQNIADKITVSAAKSFDEITLSGKIKDAANDETVTLKVFNNNGVLVYVNQIKTGANGDFSINFVPLKQSDAYVVYIANKTLGDVYSVDFDEESISELKLKPLVNGTRVYSIDEYNSASSVCVAVDNDKKLYDGEFTVAIASYKNDSLVGIEMVEKGDMLVDNNIYYHNVDEKISNADTVKIFLFNSFSNIKPLTYSVELK